MTRAELNDAVDAVLGQVPLEEPVTWAYCEKVRDRLRSEYLSKLEGYTYSMEVYHRHHELYVSIWLVTIERAGRIRGQWTKHTFTYPLS